MKVIIDIDEKVRNAINQMGLYRIPEKMQKVADRAIQFGTPLSKNHGKLVDLNEVHILLDNYMYNINGLHDYLNEELEIVVEADKEITDETDN